VKPILIVSPWFTKLVSVVIDVYAITLFPFIISKEPMGPETLNHETIHIKQQAELFVIFFYLLYVAYYFIGLVKYKDKQKAYYMIPFEQEAYEYDNQLDYLQTRKPYSWTKYKV
tara:strand:+ start:73954 stop:74295 length:342 start_codon:yes stop_codon:yes gene_type:complete